MRVHWPYYLPILLIAGPLATLQAAQAATSNSPNSPTTYAQIVRLSYVEGDVRISRGKLADKVDEKDGATATGWELAVPNLPIESGYSLITGKGRAEIEFEDASVVYLADNSVLTFDELVATNGIPYSEMSLLSGTATLKIQTISQGERFLLHTPTDFVSLRYPQKAYMRIDSYLDAVSVTPLDDMTVRLPGMTNARPEVAGQTVTYNHSVRISRLVPVAAIAPIDWNTWVAARVAAREVALSATMKDAGLSAPIPGLDQMNGQGKFFMCEPYGKCWEPANGWDGHATDLALVTDQRPSPDAETAAAAEPAQVAPVNPPATPPVASKPKRAALAGSSSPQNSMQAYLAVHPGALLRIEDYVFPCAAYGVRYLVATDSITGKDKIIASSLAMAGSPYSDFGISPSYTSSLHGLGFVGIGYRYVGLNSYFGDFPWEWAVCHAGSWIRWGHHYVWVVSGKRHHRRPVRWVKTGHTVGYVPIHPRDVAGKPPINLKDGIFKLTKKGDSVSLERIEAEEGKPLKVLDDTPKEFRRSGLEPLKIAEVPRAEAHSAYRVSVGSNGAPGENSTTSAHPAFASSSVATGFRPKGEGIPITFDRKSQSFFVAHQEVQSGRSTSVAEPLGGGRASGFQGSPASSMTRAGNYGEAQGRQASGGYSNNAGASRSSSPAPSYGGGSSGGGSYSRASAPAPSAPAPSFSGGGSGAASSAPSSGGSPHK